MDQMAPLYELLAVFKKEHDHIKTQTGRQSIHSRILTQPKRKTKTSKVTNEFKNEQKYYDPKQADTMITDLKNKVERSRDENILAEMNRVMAKKENSLENLRKKTAGKIRRMQDQLDEAKIKLDLMMQKTDGEKNR